MYKETLVCTCTVQSVHVACHYKLSDITKFTYTCTHVLSLYFPLTTVYFVSEVHCTLNVLHTQYYTLVLCYHIQKCKGNSHITIITVQTNTIVSTVDYHHIKCSSHHSM